MSRAERMMVEEGPAELRHALPRLVIGLALALFGVLYTLDNLGLVDARVLLRYWPALLIVFGGAQMVAARRRSDVLQGGFWAVLGGLFLLAHLHLLPMVSFWDLWPLVLVFFGLRMVLRARQPREPVIGAGAGDDGSTVQALAIMSGVQRRPTTVAFRGGNLTAIMGGVEVDLTAARMVADRAVIDCFACWGGIEITVPPGWVIRSNVMPLMGGFGAKVNAPAPGEATGELLVTGWAIMGGIVIKQQ